MVKRLVIARHGTVFDKEQKPLRIGRRTDLPLSADGREQAVLLGKYLKKHNINPNKAYTSSLQRTQQTANIAFKEAGVSLNINISDIFDEVDYGPDEGKTEEELVARIGANALEKWNTSAIVPHGWFFDQQKCISDWQKFADNIKEGETVMVFTSNGIARFAPYLTGDFEKFSREHTIKIATGALCILEMNGEKWHVKEWNVRM